MWSFVRDSNQDSNKRRRLDSSCILLVYSFIIPSLLHYLTDEDVLLRLLVTGSSIKPFLDNYVIKYFVNPWLARDITCWGRYIQVTVIQIFDYYDEDVRFHSKLDHLRFSDDFNAKLVQLPMSLKTLELGKNYNQPTTMLNKRVLPTSLTRLQFGLSFNQSIQPHSLPASLKSLSFDQHFNQPLSSDMIPPTLETLTLGSSFQNQLFLPPTLTSLVLGSSIHNITLEGGLPSSLTSLELGKDMVNILPTGLLPVSLKKLCLRQRVQFGSIPFGVTDLQYDFDHVLPVGSLPNTIKVLKFGDEYKQLLLSGVIPASVEHLTMGDIFHQCLFPRSIPDSVTFVQFGKYISIKSPVS